MAKRGRPVIYPERHRKPLFTEVEEIEAWLRRYNVTVTRGGIGRIMPYDEMKKLVVSEGYAGDIAYSLYNAGIVHANGLVVTANRKPFASRPVANPREDHERAIRT